MASSCKLATDKSTWQTYTDVKYGYEIRYPDTYTIQFPPERFNSTNHRLVKRKEDELNNSTGMLAIFIVSESAQDDEDFKRYVNAAPESSSSDYGKTVGQLNSYKAVTFSLNKVRGMKVTYVYYKPLIVKLTVIDSTDRYTDELDDIASTFRFVGKNYD